MHWTIECYRERLSLWFGRGFVVAIELRREDEVTTVGSTFPEGQVMPSQLLYRRVQDQLLLAAIENLLFLGNVELPDQCRTVFRLVREEGFRYKQVAEILNISPRTVETQLFRAIKKLDKVIEKSFLRL